MSQVSLDTSVTLVCIRHILDKVSWTDPISCRVFNSFTATELHAGNLQLTTRIGNGISVVNHYDQIESTHEQTPFYETVKALWRESSGHSFPKGDFLPYLIRNWPKQLFVYCDHMTTDIATGCKVSQLPSAQIMIMCLQGRVRQS